MRRSTISREQKVCMALHAVARPILRERYGPESCIVAGRIAIEVLRRFRVKATALPVQVEIGNPAYTYGLLYEAALAKGQPPPGPTPQEFGEAHVGILGSGRELAPNHIWPFHLVVIAAIGWPLLIDLTVDQVNGKIAGVNLSPILIPCPPDFAAGRAPYMCIVARHTLTYMPRLDITDYQDAPEWFFEQLFIPAADEIAQAMRKHAREL